jgi:hypothetical protein
MLLADEEDKVIWENRPLDWRHSIEEVLRKSQPD